MDGTWTWQFVHNLARNSPKLPTSQMVGFLLIVVGAVGVACAVAVFALLLLFPFWAGAELMFYLFLRARRREMQRVLDKPADMPLEVGIWHIDRIEAAADTLKGRLPANRRGLPHRLVPRPPLWRPAPRGRRENAPVQNHDP